MSAHFGSKTSKTRSPARDYLKIRHLRVDKSDFLKVAIKRSDVIAVGPSLPLVREIDDPASICPLVHIRKGNPPRVPIFQDDIKVNQDFPEDRTVYTHAKNNESERRSRSVSKSRSDKYRSRSRDRTRRNRSRSRNRSKSKDRSRRSTERSNRRSSSRRRSTSRYRSRSRERRYSLGRRKYRDRSRESRRRSRSPSLSPHKHEPSCPKYRPLSRSPSRHRRRRSITPLRPGEYRPGHPDLAVRNAKRKSRSRSRGSPREEREVLSTRRERRSPERSRSRRTPSPVPRSRRRSLSRHRSSAMPMPGMEYGFYGGFAPLPMHPLRPRFPMMDPGFYPRMYPSNPYMPRMPMNPMMHGMPRARWPIYNNTGGNKPITSKPSTVTSAEKEPEIVIIEHPVEVTESSAAVTSSSKQEGSSTDGKTSSK